MVKLHITIIAIAMIATCAAHAGSIVYQAGLDPADAAFDAYPDKAVVYPWIKETITTRGNTVEVNGTQAWAVSDGLDNSWKLPLIPEYAEAAAGGWSIVANINMGGLVEGQSRFRIAFESMFLGQLWRMDFRNAGAGLMAVQINGYSPQAGNYLPFDNEFHEFQLVYDPSSATADLYFDGSPRVLNIPEDPMFILQNRVYWGDMSGGATGAGQLYVNSLTFSFGASPAIAIPEPSAGQMILSAGLCYLLLIVAPRRSLMRAIAKRACVVASQVPSWAQSCILFALLFLSSQGVATGVAPVSTWEMGTPIVSYWGGPTPLTDDVAIRALAAGYNVISINSLAELEVAERHGLRAEISSPLLSVASLDGGTKQAQLDAFISDFSSSPVAYSYYIKDEPTASQIMNLSPITNYLRLKDPSRLSYINLHGRHPYVTLNDLGTTGDPVTAYNSYLRIFNDSINPDLFSYDHYHFLADGTDLNQYFLNLALMSTAAREAGVPFLNVVQASSFNPSFRVPDANELRFLTYTSLAYGAGGISHFSYQPRNPNSGGLAPNPDGSPTSVYLALQEINPEFVEIAEQLQNVSSVGAYHLGTLPIGGTQLPVNSPFKVLADLPSDPYVDGQKIEGVALGLFGGDGEVSNANYAIAVNLDYESTLSAVVSGPALLERFDSHSGLWLPLSGNQESVLLAPGGGKLFRIANGDQRRREISLLNPGFDDLTGITGQNNNGNWNLNNTYNLGNGTYNGWVVVAGTSGTGVINVDPSDMSSPTEATSGDMALLLSQNAYRAIQQTTLHVISQDDIAFELIVDAGSGKLGMIDCEILLYADDGISKSYFASKELLGENITPNNWISSSVSVDQSQFAEHYGKMIGIELRHRSGIEVFFDSVRLASIINSTGLLGDFNNDGSVNGRDFLAWQQAYGSPPGSLFNDNLISETVGSAHLELWQSQYGISIGNATVVIVPEPGSVILICVFLYASLTQRMCKYPRVTVPKAELGVHQGQQHRVLSGSMVALPNRNAEECNISRQKWSSYGSTRITTYHPA